jgi:hypothetical protein
VPRPERVGFRLSFTGMGEEDGAGLDGDDAPSVSRAGHGGRGHECEALDHDHELRLRRARVALAVCIVDVIGRRLERYGAANRVPRACPTASTWRHLAGFVVVQVAKITYYIAGLNFQK